MSMSEEKEKKRKIISFDDKCLKKLDEKSSVIFKPFKLLGVVTNEIPFSIGSLGNSFYIVTSVGRLFQIFDVNTLHLLFVSDIQTDSKITCLFARFEFVYASYGNSINVYEKGFLKDVIKIKAATSIRKILVVGSFLISTTSKKIFIHRKKENNVIPNEFHSEYNLSSDLGDDEIIDIIHPYTYLNKIVIASNHRLFIFNINTSKIIYKIPENDFIERITCIKQSPVLDIIAVGTAEGVFFLYNLKICKIIGSKIKIPSNVQLNVITSLSFRTDGVSLLALATSFGDIFFYNLEKKKFVHELNNVHKKDFGGISNIKFLKGQSIFITNGGDNFLKEHIFDWSTKLLSNIEVRLLRQRGGHSLSSTTLDFIDDDESHFVLSASVDKSFFVFSTRKDSQAQKFSSKIKNTPFSKKQSKLSNKFFEDLQPIILISTSQTRCGYWANILTAHTNEKFARSWCFQKKKLLNITLKTIDDGTITTVAISNCGNFGLVGSVFGGIGSYNIQSGILRKKFFLHKKPITGIAIDGFNRIMVSSSLDGILGFYDFTKSKFLGKIDLGSPITSLIYHKASNLVACSLDDLSIIIVDAFTQKIVRLLYGHTNQITSFDFSPDGKLIVSSSLDSTLRTWSLSTGGCINGLIVPSPIKKLKFSPNGEFLATIHTLGSGICLWKNVFFFKSVSNYHVDNNNFKITVLPNISKNLTNNLLEGAFENDEIKELFDFNETTHHIDESIVTLFVGSRTSYSLLLNHNILKIKNISDLLTSKSVPFFLKSSQKINRDNTLNFQNESFVTKDQIIDKKNSSNLLKLNSGSFHSYDSTFTTLLNNGSKDNNYTEFLNYLVSSFHSTLDLEISLLRSYPSLNEIHYFITAMIQGLKSNKNYDLYQSIFSLFLHYHSVIIKNNKNDKLINELMNEWYILNNNLSERVNNLLSFCCGVINFLTIF